MRVFLTGATGFIGSAIVPELIGAGHQVLGLARSEAGAKALAAAGAEIHRGTIEDLESLRSGAAKADGVIHTAFVHDFSRFKEVCELDRHAIAALGAALADSDRPLIITSGTAMANAAPGQLAREESRPDPNSPVPRVASELAGVAVAEKGGKVMLVRLPQVHDPFKQGLVTYLIAVAREKGFSAYVGSGQNRWPAVHRLDAAHLYRLVLEKGLAGGRYHPVAEEGVAVREIAESIGRGLKVPVVSQSREEASGHFGWLAHFVASDLPASSQQTREQLGWQPKGPGLIADLDQARY